MLTLSTCKMNNLCVECSNTSCLHAGKIISDCPKYRCDRDKDHFEDCETCDFIKDFQKSERKRMQKEERFYHDTE